MTNVELLNEIKMKNTVINFTKLRDGITDDNLEEVINQLLKSYGNSPFYEEIIFQSGRLNDLNRKSRMGLLLPNEEGYEKSKMRYAIIQLIHVVENYQDLSQQEYLDSHVKMTIEMITEMMKRPIVEKRKIKITEIKEIIYLSVTQGTPIYNSGNFKGCAEIYKFTLKALVLLIDSNRGYNVHQVDNGMPMPDQYYLSMEENEGKDDFEFDIGSNMDIHKRLTDELFSTYYTIKNPGKDDDSDIAWAIRNTFDRTFYMIEGLEYIILFKKQGDNFAKKQKEAFINIVNKIATIEKKDQVYGESIRKACFLVLELNKYSRIVESLNVSDDLFYHNFSTAYQKLTSVLNTWRNIDESVQ